MKKFMMVAITLIATTVINAQELKYNDLQTELSSKQYESYVAQNGNVYKVGDKIRIGLPSDGRNYVFIQHVDPVTGASPVTAGYAGREVEVKKIQVQGSKKKGYKVWVITNGGIALAKLYFDIEFALEVKEVR